MALLNIDVMQAVKIYNAIRVEIHLKNSKRFQPVYWVVTIIPDGDLVQQGQGIITIDIDPFGWENLAVSQIHGD